MSTVLLTEDDMFVVGLALDDWLAEHKPEDEDARARHEHTAFIRERLAAAFSPMQDYSGLTAQQRADIDACDEFD